jgi:hypothetical protein
MWRKESISFAVVLQKAKLVIEPTFEAGLTFRGQ